VATFIRVGLLLEGAAAIGKRDIAEMGRQAYGASAELWLATMLPNHFRPGANSKYRYRPRTARTLRVKRQLAAIGKVEDGGTQDLVHSGDLRRYLTQRQQRITRYPSRARVELQGPPGKNGTRSYFDIRYRPGRPNLAQEVITVARDEHQELTSEASLSAHKFLRTVRASRKVR
jgi:hypothetical protein